MQYNKINNLLGWLCFIIASTTYILTLEPSVSFWDCGEFISCAYRLQVSHQPGYPMFAMLGKVFSLLSFGNNTKVPFFTNMGSAIASGATVMFLFWTITAMARKLAAGREKDFGNAQTYLIMGSGLVGALAFTYTDTFWFSAVETIVFALSSLCIAVVFWAILKWEAHADEPGADRWIVFIAYVMGLSIGIHLLNLLTIPAIALVYYFRRSKNITTKSTIIAFLVGVVVLGVVQYGIRGYTVKLAAYFDLYFVNTLGFGFGTGALFFLLLLIGAIVFGIWYSIRYKKPVLNLILLCVAFIYFGYGSFAYIPIRAIANPNLNNSHPDNAFTMYGYLNREQYGDNPLLIGPYFDANVTDRVEGSIIYRKGKSQYEMADRKLEYKYDHNTLFPRMYSTDPNDVGFYKQWLQIPDGQTPNFIDNLSWLGSWQIYQMYVRYFLWNFVGRYNDEDGQQSTEWYDGNWTSGIFDGGKHLPKSILNNPTYTPLYALPLVLGLVGMGYQLSRKKRDALIVALLWFFTGIAVVLYVNQPSVQPRERDYSYVGSFYAFAIWIGLAVMGLGDIRKGIISGLIDSFAQFFAMIVGWVAAPFSKKIEGFAIKLQTSFNKVSPKAFGILVTLLCLAGGPVLIGCKEWRAHDRSTKMTPHDMAYNYLISCPPNAILFTYGDNDTYSLWYDQEVEGIRPDVRLVNLSLFTADWYIRQMQKTMNKSAPLPITMPFDKYKEGIRDGIHYTESGIKGYTTIQEVFNFITSDDRNLQAQTGSGKYVNYLPTQNFKLNINADDVLKNKVITPGQKGRLDSVMKWRYPAEWVTKEDLALFDILAHNNWKRPICFTTTIGTSNTVGLMPYLYKEGFAYHLIPFKVDTANHNQDSKTNTLVMYDNVMNKFRFGNFKKAKYLDHESVTMFYPVMMTTFLDLATNLAAEGHGDLALKALHKFDEEMPEDLYPYVDIAKRKSSLAEIAYRLGDINLGNKFTNSIHDYIKDLLQFNYYNLQHHQSWLNPRDVRISLGMLEDLSGAAQQQHQDALYKSLSADLENYRTKLQVVFNM